MNIEAELKKDGIEIVGRLDTLSVNSLAKTVAEKICKAFPRAHFSTQQLFIEFSRLPMYLAKMPEGFAEANYFYKNSSIYFKEGIPIEELEKFAIHEFIHFLQEVKDNKGNLYRLGLCEYGEFKTYGMALNEGAVQLATAKTLHNEEDIVKYYDISFPTTSPNYYPILCNLVKQLAYLIGDDLLFESTFFSTDAFKLETIKCCGKKEFLKIQENLDKILYTEEKIIKLNGQLLEDNCEGQKALKVASKIANLKLELKKTFIQTQDLIFSSYFNNEFYHLTTTDDIEIYRARLYNYKNYIGITDNYFDFNNYYIDKMAALEERYDAIMNNVSLTVVKESKLANLFKAIRNLFSWNKETQNE
ncbi:MAG: hypothetical protein HFJ28_06880 [Clostridia bacterium]|nr:hypothetical protein [Clostridia bacterium]